MTEMGAKSMPIHRIRSSGQGVIDACWSGSSCVTPWTFLNKYIAPYWTNLVGGVQYRYKYGSSGINIGYKRQIVCSMPQSHPFKKISMQKDKWINFFLNYLNPGRSKMITVSSTPTRREVICQLSWNSPCPLICLLPGETCVHRRFSNLLR